ncbi:MULTISPECIES: HD domain-containing protein [Bradyrhizobium]|uniref:HD domain-containing protein n=1 Tax=Bradyrhizobium elkanii TaxID=29448 RepID=UPI0004898B53|nr:HD domain-containing protein [Bradyrhizobium elkanii]
MSIEPTKRIRDPIHGLIVFNLSDEIDRAAWELLDTPEFQRLRRVKQLGVSEFTFPGATHTRFAHCVGVFHVARRLMKVAISQIPVQQSTPHRMRVSLLAALLHDLGHGPFSHAFEEAEKSRLRGTPGAYKSHEQWTAEIITNPAGQVRKILSKSFGASMAEEVAELLKSEPADLYAAVVSSSFDADRLDYLQRDKLMTGSGAGRTRMQKTIYLLDALGLRSGASYYYYNFGPFSDEVTNGISDSKFSGILFEEIGYRVSDGSPFSIFKADKPTGNIHQVGALPADTVKGILQHFASCNSIVLELAATIHWLARVEKVSDWRGELVRRKGSKTQGGRMEKAAELLGELGISLKPPSDIALSS